MEKQATVYIMASKKDGALYIGVTSHLVQRVYEHKKSIIKGFTQKYKVYNLVYFEVFDNMLRAIEREKQLKKWKRSWKVRLIEKNNPEWNDLYLDIL